jgi:head-tail adaptor
LARAARNGRSQTSHDVRGHIELQRLNLRGRRPVRADRRLRTDEKHIRAQSVILDKNNPKSLLFSSVWKTRLARAARNGRVPTSADVGGYLKLRRSNLRGRRPVRADRRLRTDEKHIRAQSAILDKSNPKPLLLLSMPARRM